MMKGINKILIANRGEIAARIIRSAKKMGKKTLVFYTGADKGSIYTLEADEAVQISQGSLADTYLNIDFILDFAKAYGADAVHPGYGFLSENPQFAIRCMQEGLTWIGPMPEQISQMGIKDIAKQFAANAGVPVLKSFSGQADELLIKAKTMSFPILIKPVAGGGGKGMVVVNHIDELNEAMTGASRQAKNIFGNGALYIEEFIPDARHIEVQVVGDVHGNIIHLYERECSVQRRYQKIVEEAPSPSLNDSTRQEVCNYALSLAEKMAYQSAGTVEFLMSPEGHFYFIEMNTRIQVEHPVTEEITGVDLVAMQIEIAEGKTLQIQQNQVIVHGHAIESRIYAENPSRGFIPVPGSFELLDKLQDKGIRYEETFASKGEVSPNFDPMIAKIITKGQNREEAIEKQLEALNQYLLHGTQTNLGFLNQLIGHKDFVQNKIHTRYLDQHLSAFVNTFNALDEKYFHYSAASCIFAQLQQHSSIKNNHYSSFSDGWRMLQRFSLTIAGQYFAYSLVHFSKNRLSLDYMGTVIHFSLDESPNGRMAYKVKMENEQDTELEVSVYKVRPHEYVLSVFGQLVDVYNYLKPKASALSSSNGQFPVNGKVNAPLSGRLTKLLVKEGDRVEAGVNLALIESMKMENNVMAHKSGTIKEVYVAEGQMVNGNQALLDIE